MREIRAIIAAQKEAESANRKTILATVVHVEGSSYRRPSARMLVDETGLATGAISGGCLEGDALRKALFALTQRKNLLITYDTSDEEDAIVGAQLGCNGVIQVLFEPINPEFEDNPIRLLEKAIEKRQTSILISLFRLKDKDGFHQGTSLLIEQDKLTHGSVNDDRLLDQLLADSSQVVQSEHSIFRAYETGADTQNVFIEYFPPAISLVIVGAGNDTQGLAQMAETLGWKIYVVDGRPTHAKEERFAPSCQVIVAKPEEAFTGIPIDDRTACVLMTHNYNYDLAVLKSLITNDSLPYIGILGPKKKFNRMLEDLDGESIRLSENQLGKIYAPIGLEIGAETPEEIAISVLSEIQAVFSNTMGSSLRDKTSPIHSSDNTQFDTIKI